jgi:prepilin-type N-terminal cleavage/methylation domain-containing protein
MPARRPSGFTLVELLVVIGIIALLLSVLLPALSSARVAASRAASMSNLRQIGIALQMYTDEHKGRFPEVAHSIPADRSWVYSLRPYLGDVDAIRICPADPRGADRQRVGGTSYMLNEYVTVPLVDPFGTVLENFTKRDRIRRQSETVMAFIASDDAGVGTVDDHTHSRNWFRAPVTQNWTRIIREIQPDRFTTRPVASRTRGTTLLLYLDAHVEIVDAAELKRKADANVNFAAIPR